MMCRLCSHNISNITRLGVPLSNLTADDYCITDMRFGTHLSIYDCPECGLRQCESSLDLDKFYINLVDDDYERDRSTRYKQMLDLLNFLDSPSVDNKEGAKLLDVGAGSGILIEAALSLGLDSLGIEPSLWLNARAQEHGLPIMLGTIDIIPPQKQFDFITLIDVIEHICDPIGMLRQCSSLLNNNGKLLIVTPDSASLVARLLGYRWWHYRIAHISYFNITTLKFALAASGLQVIAVKRPRWWFTLDYLCERLLNYLPNVILPRGKWLEKIQIPVNLFDSIAVICSTI